MGVNCSQSVPVYVTQRCGSSWVVVDRCGSLWIVVGSLWVVVDRCGSLWVVPGFSNYGEGEAFLGNILPLMTSVSRISVFPGAVKINQRSDKN